jgi:hypothetical protein
LLSVIKLKKLSEIYNLSILNDDQTWVVAPNPSSADIFRDGLAQHSLPPLEVITISSLINKLISQIEVKSGHRKSKSELLPLLATIWKIKGQSLVFNSFLEIFELFTELRSFSIQAHLFDEIFEILPGQQGEVVQIFWNTLNEMNIFDEHAEVATLASALKNNQELELPKKIVIWGFNHLNANQVDLIKSLSLWVDVEVPVHEKTYLEKKPTDYLSWLDSEEKPVEIQPEAEAKPKVEILQYGAGRLAESLKVYFEERSVDHILLSEKKISQSMRMEVPVKNLMAKTECDIFSGELKKFKEYLKAHISMTNNEMSSEEVKKQSQSYKARSIKDKKAPNFRAYKVVELFEDALLEYEQLSVHNEKLSDYDIDVLMEVVSLDQPRSFSIPVGLVKYKKSLYSLNQIQQIPQGLEVVMCISSRYNPILRSSSSLSFEMSQKLSSIGPLQNPRLEYLTYKMELLDLFEMNPVTILIEAELEESDLGWKEIFDECEVQERQQKSYKKKLNIRPWDLTDVIKTPYLSASRLQLYKECPRKYYHNYIEPFEGELVKEHLFEARELGEMEHKVIEMAYKSKIDLGSMELLNLVKKTLSDYIRSKNKKIAEHQYRIYQDEIYILARNGLAFVDSLKRLPGLTSIEFEVKLERLFPEAKEKGSIDLLVRTNIGIILIDFKRSSGSIPHSLASFLRFEKIQLWFYLKRMVQSMEDVIGFGYFNLSDMEKSLLVSPADEAMIDLNEALEELSCKFMKPKIELGPIFYDYGSFENELSVKMLSDKEFKIDPEDSDSCSYCSVRMICPRKDIGRVL